MQLVYDQQGVARCWWGSSTEDYRQYHDLEWGRPVIDGNRLFEKVCLEGFQAGLSWLTILRKRPAFREAFAGFDPELVARFGESDVERLLADAGIVRHRGKIRSTINNAQRALDLIDEQGSLASYFWSWAEAEQGPPAELAPVTPASTALSKDLKKRGWTFVGPTTVYAFMEAVGIVNDHLTGCVAQEPCAAERRRVLRGLIVTGKAPGRASG
jgi:DNA-3-methyladenine glycosylase I